MKSAAQSDKKYGFWNWGTGLAIAIVAGCLGIIFLVYTATTYEFQMVDSDYYEKEVEFNDKVLSIKNTDKLQDTLHFTMQNNHLIIAFPEDVIGKKVNGTLNFYCPVDAEKDFSMPLVFNDKNIVAVDASKMLATQYNISAQFTIDEERYYLEQVYMVNK